MRRDVLLICAAVALAGCSDDSTNTESTTAATESTTAEPALPEPITAQGAERVKLADRLQAEIEIGDGPDWMVEGFGSLWVKRDNGVVDRIDPANGKVIDEISAGEFDEPLCQGIGVSEDSIWACPALGDPAGQVVRIDPERNEVASTLRTKKMPDQGRMVTAADRLWLLTDGGARLTGVDLASEKEATEVRLGETCTDLAASGTTLYAACPIDGHVLRIDAETGEVAAEGEFEGARTASVNGDLWVAFEGGVAQADPQSLEISALYDVDAAFGGTVYATDDEVWVRQEGGPFLTRIDPDEERIVETIEAPKLPSGGDVIVIGDSVWASAADDGVVVQLKG